SQGVEFLEVPVVKSRSEGGVHIYGNPHIQNSPLNGKIIAKNIATGLSSVDPNNGAYYEERYKQFCHEIDERLFGAELVRLMGSQVLNRQVKNSDEFIEFLKTHDYQGEPLFNQLGGWLKQGLPMRGKKVIGYHKNWAYFNSLFGLKMVNYVEPKPSIPPTPKHLESVIEQMQAENIDVVVAANYFPEDRVRALANKVGAKVVIVPLDVNGVPEVLTYFDYIDYLVENISAVCE
ncbi:MAG: zinc ABC transporter substrate-binding protein, partial [Proteobacteria bacterium]|nr:zinc ABC transporter substrate-binding protein [Pseudomonadota bacterium]